MEGFQEELVSALREVVSNSHWQCVGEKRSFKATCTKLFSEDGEHLVLIHTTDDKFYAMDSSCPHEGGPLEQGDIEELCDGRLALTCPWHYFEFCLDDGSSSTGLQNQVYEVKVYEGKVYIQTQNALSLTPWKETPCTVSVNSEPAAISQGSDAESTLSYWACKILSTADPQEKVKLTQHVQTLWESGKISEIGQMEPPAQPQRKENLIIVQPGRIKRGKGGTLSSRIALLHSMANIEQWAIDLSWDIIARFAHFRLCTGETLPRDFFSDFVKVAGDEAKHYSLLEKRLAELDSNFGALPVHNGLWQSAADTAHDLLGRLAIVHMVHEARGLDVHPQTMQRFSTQGDDSSVRILEVIYTDEITHVAAGLKWFTYICGKEQRDCLSTFHELVPLYFKGYLKPPFNTEGRRSAGMSEEWYLPLVKPS
uniref:Rieske domain-containing protein n=1 Tax=Xenopus tropicalis TaxID=8364 RepID=A0A6I8R635_XENTR